MSASHHNQAFPRATLWAATSLVVVSLLGAALAHLTNTGRSAMATTSAVEVRNLRFEDRPEGTIAIFRDGERQLADVIPAGGNGFVRGVLRGLARERVRQHGVVSAPFRLTRWADGRLSVGDPSTGRSVDVAAFGPDNYGAFARIFTATAPRIGNDAALADSAASAPVSSPARHAD